MSETAPNGLFECPKCGRREPTELFLVFCCTDDEDRGRGIYRGID